jgi:hypothetical protein
MVLRDETFESFVVDHYEVTSRDPAWMVVPACPKHAGAGQRLRQGIA